MCCSVPSLNDPLLAARLSGTLLLCLTVDLFLCHVFSSEGPLGIPFQFTLNTCHDEQHVLRCSVCVEDNPVMVLTGTKGSADRNPSAELGGGAVQFVEFPGATAVSLRKHLHGRVRKPQNRRAGVLRKNGLMLVQNIVDFNQRPVLRSRIFA